MKNYIYGLLALTLLLANSASAAIRVFNLITDSTTTVTSNSLQPLTGKRTMQAKGITSSGAGAATILVEVTNDLNFPWETQATLTLTLGTTVTSDSVSVEATFKYQRIRISAISGTGATVSANMSEEFQR